MTAFCYTDGQGTIVTPCGAVTGLALSAAIVGFSREATLSWQAAQPGVGNPVADYAIYKNGVLLKSVTETHTRVTAANEAANDVYTVQARGVVKGLDGPISDGVTLTAHAPEYEQIFFTSNGAYTIPAWSECVDVTCIGGGGGGAGGGASYSGTSKAYPGGGGGGGSGEMLHAFGAALTPGESYSVTVGQGGAAGGMYTNGSAGGASALGTFRARGGNGGTRGDNEALSNGVTSNGGAGGSGGIGGTGGGRGYGLSATEGYGSDGATGASWLAWNGWSTAQWYAFEDAASLVRLGRSGSGGRGIDGGAYDVRAGQGASDAAAPGVSYGSGGRGGDQWKTGGAYGAQPGTDGLVAVRCWRYL